MQTTYICAHYVAHLHTHHICIYRGVYKQAYAWIHNTRILPYTPGWIQLVGYMKLQVSFAKEPYKRDDILQKRPFILSILLIVATPYPCMWINLQFVYVWVYTRAHSHTLSHTHAHEHTYKNAFLLTMLL